MATALDKPKKARLSQPKVYQTEPDETLQRYHVELFNPATGKAKDASYESINFELYKPGAKSIAFSTSETRIALWIRCFKERYHRQLNENEDNRVTWEEQDSAGNSALCDRIILHLYGKGEQLVAITIYISTGTILVQGKWFRNFGLLEFPILLDIVNHMSLSTDATESYWSTPICFLTETPMNGQEQSHETQTVIDVHQKEKADDGNIKETPETPDTKKTETERTSNFHKTLDDDIKSAEPEPLMYTPSRLHTFTALRNTLANMESDYTEFKMSIAQSLQEIQATMAEGEIQTKDRLSQLDNTLKLRIKHLETETSEMKNTQRQMQEEIARLTSTTKKLQEQLTSAQKQNNALLKQQEIMKIELESFKATCPQTPCHHLPGDFMSPQVTTQSTSLNTEEEEAQPQTEDKKQNKTLSTAHSNTPSDIPLHNRFEILREEPAKSDSEPTRNNKKQEPNRTPKTNKKTTANIILCDSNGKYLRMNKLCPNQEVTYHRCPTITTGHEIINNLPSDPAPQMILIHTGTNDLERINSADLLASKINDMITATAKKFPSSKILYSTLLPRQDVPFDEIRKINSSIGKLCSRIANVHLIDHSNLSQQNILHDIKHLNQTGVKRFAKNLKDAIYGRKSRVSNSPTEVWRRPQLQRESYPTLPQTTIPHNNPSYAAVVQYPSPTPMIHAPTTPRIHKPTTEAATLPAIDIQRRPDQGVPTVQAPLPTMLDIQQQMDLQGHTMNISIPKKILPLIQLLNSLI